MLILGQPQGIAPTPAHPVGAIPLWLPFLITFLKKSLTLCIIGFRIRSLIFSKPG